MTPPLLVIDFETYYDAAYTIKKMTLAEYVHDPRFRVHGVAIREPEGPARFEADAEGALDRLRCRYGDDLGGAIVTGHNLAFDLYVLNHRYGVRPARILDTLQLAYHVHGRRDKNGHGVAADLGSLAARYGLRPKGDLDFMSGVLQPDGRQLAELAAYAAHDTDLTHALSLKLLPGISDPKVELPLMAHTLRLFTERGLRVDLPTIDELRSRADARLTDTLTEAGVARVDDLRGGAFTAELGRRLAATRRSVPTKQGKNGPIAATAKKDEAMQRLAADVDPAVASLARAKLAASADTQFRAGLDKAARIAAATGGRLPVALVYCGAHTGRFAGGGGINLQNMARGDDGLTLRHALRPAEGHLFVIADLAQIEARVIAWYAGEASLLDGYRRGADNYSLFAQAVFREEVRKPRKDDPPPVAARLDALRKVGKEAVLGLGYAMGAARFHEQLRAKPELRALFDGGTLSEDVCRELVGEFRDRYAGIPDFWNALECGFQELLTGRPVDRQPRGLLLARDNRGPSIRLPSERVLRYDDVRLETELQDVSHRRRSGEWVMGTCQRDVIRWGETTLYGGRLAENVVQATARDVLARAILELERRGLRVVLHVHDEVVVEAPEAEAEPARREVDAVLSAEVPWAPGLPVSCETHVKDRYGK